MNRLTFLVVRPKKIEKEKKGIEIIKKDSQPKSQKRNSEQITGSVRRGWEW